MNKEQEQLLELFKEGEEFSTSEIVTSVYNKELSQEDNRNIRAKFHRKIIYHLNKLVEKNILNVSRYKSKGEKCFCLTNDLIFDISGRKIKLEKKNYTLKGLENDPEIIDYKPFGIMVNSILINAHNIDLPKLSNMIKDLYTEVNDVIAIINVEKILLNSNNEELENFFLGIISLLNKRKLVFIINYENPKYHFLNKAINALNKINDEINPKNVEFVLLLKEDNLLKNTKELINNIDLLKDSGFKINICKHGKKIIFPGNAGVYTVEYDTHITEKLVSVITTNSLCVDLDKIKNFSAQKIKEQVLRIIKSLHHVNSYQQIEFEQLFPIIKNYQGNLDKASNTIRLWNYDWKTDSYLLDLFEELKQEIEEFTYNEENIYVSCGIPINFKIKLGSTFFTFDNKKLSQRNYEKNVIHNLSELRTSYAEYLAFRAKYYSMFDQGDRLRIFRKQDDSKELIKEFHYLLISNIKFFTYDFRNMTKEINLRDFM